MKPYPNIAKPGCEHSQQACLGRVRMNNIRSEFTNDLNQLDQRDEIVQRCYLPRERNRDMLGSLFQDFRYFIPRSADRVNFKALASHETKLTTQKQVKGYGYRSDSN